MEQSTKINSSGTQKAKEMLSKLIVTQDIAANALKSCINVDITLDTSSVWRTTQHFFFQSPMIIGKMTESRLVNCLYVYRELK